MRAYEFAKKVGIDYGSVVQLAEDNGIEIYSPLTQFEADEAETLHAAYLRADRTAFAARLAAIAEKRHAKILQLSQARVAEARREAPELEAGRKRALAAAGLDDLAKPLVVKDAPIEKPTAVKDLKDLMGGSVEDAAEKPKETSRISIEVSATDEDDDALPQAEDLSKGDVADDDEDEDAELEYLHGKDRRAQPTGKAAKMQQQA